MRNRNPSENVDPNYPPILIALCRLTPMDKIEVTRVHAITLESKNLFECWGVEDAHLACCDRAGKMIVAVNNVGIPRGVISGSHGCNKLYYGINDSSLYSVVTNLPLDPT